VPFLGRVGPNITWNADQGQLRIPRNPRRNAPPNYKCRVYILGQKRRTTPAVARVLRRRPAIEPVIGHLEAEQRMGRNYRAHRAGDAANAILAAVGYNFRPLI
jgi:transposase, IS5 family